MEIIAVLILISILTALAVPKFIDLSVSAKKKASAAGIAEFNSREKLLWSRAKLINDSAILSSDEVMDQHLFDSMDFNLNSGTDDYWDYSGGSWSAAGIAGTLEFKGVESGIWRYPATLDQPGRWKFSENIGTALFSGFTSTDDFSETWGSAGKWTVNNGTLRNNGQNGFMHIAGTKGENYSITLDATLNSGDGYGVIYKSTKTTNYFPDGYGFQFDPGKGNVFIARNFSDGKESLIKEVKMTDIFGPDFDLTAKHKISVEVVNNNHTISVDDKVVLEFSDDSHTSGSVGLRNWGGSNAIFNNVQVVEK